MSGTETLGKLIWPLPLTTEDAPNFLMGQESEAGQYCLEQNTRFAKAWLAFCKSLEGQSFDIGDLVIVWPRDIDDVGVDQEIL